jgi:hypothetical protein
MNKIDKFRGKLEITVEDKVYLLTSLKVNDLFDLLLLNKQEDEQFTFGCNLLKRVFVKSFEDEPVELIEQFVIENYVELLEGVMISLGWTTKEKLKELREAKSKPEEVTKEKGLALFKARLSAEADAQDIEDKYITTSYVLMREFKYKRDEILDMDATVFLILIEEMNKQNEKEKEEMKKNKTMRKQ